MSRTGYVNGSDIALLVNVAKEGQPEEWKVLLGAKSHKRQVKANTKSIVDKDTENSKFQKKSVKTVDVSISVDCFVKLGEDGISAAEIDDLCMQGKEVKLRYGYRTAQTGDTYVEGFFIIDSFEESSQAQEEMTFTASFSNSGEVKRVKATTTTTPRPGVGG